MAVANLVAKRLGVRKPSAKRSDWLAMVEEEDQTKDNAVEKRYE